MRNAFSIIVLCCLGFACAGTHRGAREEGSQPSSWAETTLASLSLDEKVGQMIYAKSEGGFLNEADEDYRTLVAAAQEGRIGGVVFFQGQPFETAAIVNHLQEAARIPLLMASDYEWGAAMRVEGASQFPSAMAIGAGGTVADVELQAEVTAREARALGIRLLLNPVLDLNTNPENTVINTRSFGEDPKRASELGVAFIRRAQDQGVLTTAKHFPGHGATAVDSHVGLPVVRAPRGRLERVELAPFRAAIDAGVAAIMPAHMAVPALGGGSNRPATMSKEILQGVLRGELGFQGLIVSDALDMEGARGTVWDGELAVEAVRAGVDMLILPPDPLVAHDALVRAVGRGDLSVARIDASVRRILQAKERLGLHRRRTVDLADLPRRLASPTVQERIERMTSRTVTLIQNRKGIVPLPGKARILLVDFVPNRNRRLDSDILTEELARRAHSLRRVRLSPASATDRVDELAPQEDEVVLFASFARGRSLREGGEEGEVLLKKLDALARSGHPVVFASLGNPYVLSGLPEAQALIAMYDHSPAAQRALARALFGESAIGGKLPVALSAEYPLSRGLKVQARRMKLEYVKDPEDVGMSKKGLEEAVDVVRDAIEDGTSPGAVMLVGRRGKIVLEQALGRMTYDKDAPRVTTETLYDLASLTKVIVTTTLSMILHERGQLDLDAPVREYLPEFRGGQKDEVLVEDLLAHSGGLLWWTDLYKRYEGESPQEAKRGYLETIYGLPLDYAPRSKMVYSDLGLLLLGEILERVTGKTLDVLADQEIFEPLDMVDVMYRPPESLRPRIAPTERDPWRGRVVHGEVHDENAFGLGGIAPHAGLFATARGLAPFAQMMLNGGAYNGKRLLKRDTIARFTSRANLVAGSSRALGWDTPSEPSSAGQYFSASSYGHTGFTGTSIWIDPERELFAILLTNRVYPTRENPKISVLRPTFHDAVMQAIEDMPIDPRVDSDPEVR
jgi:beta-N-acetylhexosaminidase